MLWESKLKRKGSLLALFGLRVTWQWLFNIKMPQIELSHKLSVPGGIIYHPNHLMNASYLRDNIDLLLIWTFQDLYNCFNKIRFQNHSFCLFFIYLFVLFMYFYGYNKSYLVGEDHGNFLDANYFAQLQSCPKSANIFKYCGKQIYSYINLQTSCNGCVMRSAICFVSS